MNYYRKKTYGTHLTQIGVVISDVLSKKLKVTNS